MALVIKQLSTTDRENAATFWEQFKSKADQSGESGDPSIAENTLGPNDASLDTHLSLIALDDGETVGLTLCHFDQAGGHRHRLTVTTSGDDESLTRMLIDKSLGKFTTRHVHKCKVFLRDGTQPEQLWQHATWMFDGADIANETSEPIDAAADADVEFDSDSDSDSDAPSEPSIASETPQQGEASGEAITAAPAAPVSS